MTEHPTAPSSDALRDQASYWFTQREAMAHNLLLRQRFEQWRSADGQHAEAYRAVENLWQASAFEQALEHLALDLDLPAAPPRKVRRPARWLATAAALLLMLGVAWVGDLPLRLQADHLTGIAQLERFDLADGSHIVLGSDSAISSNFSASHRRIRLLRGELYIEAFHDQSRPLTIEAGSATVTVVGTRFSVSRQAEGVTVAVREGRVRLAEQNGQQSLLQAGNWQRVQDHQLQPLNLEGSERQMAWVNGRLSFQNTPLAEVLGQVRRYYRAPILLFNPLAGQQQVSGNYQLDDPLAIVQALSKVSAIQLTRLPGGILLLR
ncbi:FecR domain-containing protein [Pseudomonas sp. NFXW11]|uniref:FecR family protein n=1 Tax=Pseudomonas sp. NFXW11 TaxID=2819531 RepID=UPI003CEA54B1